MKKALEKYFAGLYERTMRLAYGKAVEAVGEALRDGGGVLDSGAGSGGMAGKFREKFGLDPERYHGIEWDAGLVSQARSEGCDIVQGDLNRALPYPDGRFRCVVALSVLEHLLNPCRFIRESQRVLEPGGTLVLLTPNISTYFTAVLILAGKMPSSGPHPDSDMLLKTEEPFMVRGSTRQPDTEADAPQHRHLVVFSYRVLKKYLYMAGFREVRGYAYGIYPFPNFLQPVLERIDAWHCHQMVFVARK